MSKELIKRLRSTFPTTQAQWEAADRIQELERENNWLKAAMNKYSEDEILCSLQALNAELVAALTLATTYHEKKCDCAGCKALAKVRKP